MRAILLLLVFFATTVVSATGVSGYQAVDVDWKQLRPGISALDSWRQAGLRSYQYRLRAQCQCPLNGDSTVYVIDGVVVRVEADNGQPRNLTDALKQRLHIPALHTMISRYAAQQPDRMAWKLNRYLGYPEMIDIDPSYRIADDEIHYTLSDFKVLVKRRQNQLP